MQTNYKKTILMTLLYTLISLILVTAVIALLMFFVFTKDCANLMYNIGCDTVASNLYYKTYQKSGEIQYCYKALNIKIKLNDSENIVKYYDSLVSDSEYSNFINSIIANNEKLQVGVLEKSSLLNEEDYLVNRYVRALIAINEKEKAWELTLSNFAQYDSWTFKNQGVYAIGEFVSDSNKYMFNVSYDGLDDTLINVMQDYFADAYSIFNANSSASSNVEKSYLMALGNRIIKVGQDINNIYASDQTKSDIKADNIDIMIEVNNIIKGLI